ncbi:MAG: helix-turn-helix domain-containing protein [Spirochaetia bacterium]|jgi:mannitol operon transcriptional antiterminator|nr:helix-turn-helix domain-containing protein [Spirochaetia bacterium]
MKERQKQVLRLLLANNNIVRIDDIASSLSAGSRTVSRDLDYLERWLSTRGVYMERKTNQGIRIINYGTNIDHIIETLNSSDATLSELDPAERQKFIFLYLLYNNREIKISEIANVFFVSDTCIWNDLNSIEAAAQKRDIYLVRHKGVGISISGEESNIRFTFLDIFAEIFSHKTIINYLYSENHRKSESAGKYRISLLMKYFKLPEDTKRLFSLVTHAENILGYKFTISGEAFLYFYLFQTGHRIHSGALITASPPAGSVCSPKYREAASELLDKLGKRIMSGIIPEQEVDVLGIILQVLEAGDFSHGKLDDTGEDIPEEIDIFAQKLMAALEKSDNVFYYLDNELAKVIRISAASLILRLKNHIPHWKDDWNENVLDNENDKTVITAIKELIKNEFALDAAASDIQNLLLHFNAAAIKNQVYPKRKVRCIIFCFEGIGLASYLFSVIKREISGIDVVEATAVYKLDQEYLDLHQIDLVISTFPVENIQTPLVLVSLPIDIKILDKNINDAISNIKTRARLPVFEEKTQEEASASFSVNNFLSFIQEFAILESEKPEPPEKTVKIISQYFSNNIKSEKALERDFLDREKLGPLYFEEYGIRMIHCKSSSVKKPFGGIIRYKQPAESEQEVVFLAAPDPCPEGIRKMLSEITFSILENPVFRESLKKSDIDTLRTNLLYVYRP